MDVVYEIPRLVVHLVRVYFFGKNVLGKYLFGKIFSGKMLFHVFHLETATYICIIPYLRRKVKRFRQYSAPSSGIGQQKSREAVFCRENPLFRLAPHAAGHIAGGQPEAVNTFRKKKKPVLLFRKQKRRSRATGYFTAPQNFSTQSTSPTRL